jgi:hypothetical protein
MNLKAFIIYLSNNDNALYTEGNQFNLLAYLKYIFHSS